MVVNLSRPLTVAAVSSGADEFHLFILASSHSILLSWFLMPVYLFIVVPLTYGVIKWQALALLMWISGLVSFSVPGLWWIRFPNRVEAISNYAFFKYPWHDFGVCRDYLHDSSKGVTTLAQMARNSPDKPSFTSSSINSLDLGTGVLRNSNVDAAVLKTNTCHTCIWRGSSGLFRFNLGGGAHRLALDLWWVKQKAWFRFIPLVSSFLAISQTGWSPKYIKKSFLSIRLLILGQPTHGIDSDPLNIHVWALLPGERMFLVSLW